MRPSWARTTPGAGHSEQPRCLYMTWPLLGSRGTRCADSIQTRESTQGKDHPDLATPLTNLGELIGEMVGFPEAEALPPCLTIRETALGKDHPEVANTLNNLALVLEMARLRRGRGTASAQPGDSREASWGRTILRSLRSAQPGAFLHHGDAWRKPNRSSAAGCRSSEAALGKDHLTDGERRGNARRPVPGPRPLRRSRGASYLPEPENPGEQAGQGSSGRVARCTIWRHLHHDGPSRRRAQTLRQRACKSQSTVGKDHFQVANYLNTPRDLSPSA